MNIAGHAIGVCSWSLHASGIAQTAALLRQAGLEHVQLALRSLLFLDDKQKYRELGDLRASGLHVASVMLSFPGEDYSSIARLRQTGGFVPDDQWTLRKQIVTQSAKLAAEIGCAVATTHVGAVPPSNHADYPKMVQRVNEAAEILAVSGTRLLVETGPEEASVLLQFLNDLSVQSVGVNFDPGNLILYGSGDPIAAVHTLGRRIGQVHIKDAIASAHPGETWGREMPFGQGQVGAAKLLMALHDAGYTGPLIIEREVGDDRVADIKAAVTAIQTAAEELRRAG